MDMTYHTAPRDFCKTVDESYSFDNKVVGLEDIAQCVAVKEVSPQELSDSGRFKRGELAARLNDEEGKCITLEMKTNDISTSHVLTSDGFAYSTSHPPVSAKGCYIFKPKREELSREEKRRILQAA